MTNEIAREAKAVIDSLLHQIGQMQGMFDDEDGTIAEAVEGAEEFVATLSNAKADPQHVALNRIRARLAGEWYDPTGDLESDIAKVLRELDGAAPATGLRPWQPMSTAPLDGKHCILAVKSGGCFVYSVQGAFHQGQWNCAMGDNVQPLCWMPNVLIPDEFLPWKNSAVSEGSTDG